MTCVTSGTFFFSKKSRPSIALSAYNCNTARSLSIPKQFQLTGRPNHGRQRYNHETIVYRCESHSWRMSVGASAWPHAIAFANTQHAFNHRPTLSKAESNKQHARVLHIIGPILWGHSGPLCHALSLSSSSSLLLLLWTSACGRRATRH